MKKLISTLSEKVTMANFSWWQFWSNVFMSKYTRARKPLWLKAYNISHHRANVLFQEIYATYYN